MVPTTLITGFFGVGKTTTIQSLLAKKESDEVWAVLVNEFGEISVDHAAIEMKEHTDNVIIREIPGGCMCCMMNVPMREAISEILYRVKPDRLLIEPTGIGHPAGILDELRDPQLSKIIQLKAIICLIDPRHAMDPRIQNVQVFKDQVFLSDVLVASKADLATADELTVFHDWAEQLFPPKLRISEVCNGNLEISLLDLDVERSNISLFHETHVGAKIEANTNKKKLILNPGKPHRALNNGAGFQGCGWIFSDKDLFDKNLLLDLLGPPGLCGLPNGSDVERLKGVFRLGKETLFVNRVRNEITLSEIAYRNDSRLEVVISQNIKANWGNLESKLKNCLVF